VARSVGLIYQRSEMVTSSMTTGYGRLTDDEAFHSSGRVNTTIGRAAGDGFLRLGLRIWGSLVS
ncbi:Hypothetical predicted protein, partial [Olea europaea subsp. europaea]